MVNVVSPLCAAGACALFCFWCTPRLPWRGIHTCMHTARLQPDERHCIGKTHGSVQLHPRRMAPPCSGAEGCQKRPTFNFPGVKPAKFCGSHKEEGMVNVVSPLCAAGACALFCFWCTPRLPWRGIHTCMHTA